MAVYLDEDFIGVDSRQLVFPNLLLCMGLGCLMSDGSLVGCHISGSSTEDAVLAEVKSRIASRTGTPRWLFMFADFHEHFLDRKLSFTAKARAIGFAGEIFVLDTRPRVGKGGAYVRLVSNGGATPCDAYLHAEKDAQPYATGSPSTLPPGSAIVKYSSFHKAIVTPGSIKIGDSAPRPGTAIAHADLKIVRCL